MVISKKYLALMLTLIPMGASAVCDHDVIVELKGEAFIPTNCRFKEIYGNAIGEVGGEVTFQLSSCNEHWYGFASIDYLSKKGDSIGLCVPTKVELLPLAIGLKYFFPFCYGNFYLGLGFEPVYVKTDNCSPYVAACTSQWAFGGIAKIGTYFDLPCDWVFDLFVDYSFAKTGCKCLNAPSAVIPLKANIDSVIVGAGLGYRF